MGLPVASIGLVGHIDHGKTTLTQRLSGVWTDRHSEELKRGITIRLGYADCTFYLCSKCGDPKGYGVHETCDACKGKTKELRTISFVDAPGHETLMATMLSGASIMDGALLVIAANEPCPQPQTKEHLMALDIVGVKNIVIAQNKVDAVSAEDAKKNYEEIKAFVKGTVAEKAPIIPISAEYGANIDILIKTIEETIPTPKDEKSAEPIMFIARSFDVNKPGTPIAKLKGGVLGGALIQGELSVGDEVEICPTKEKEPTKTKIISLMCGGESVKKVTRGGTFGIETPLDPFYVKSDKCTGKVLGTPGKLPPVREQLNLEVHLLDRVVGSDDELEIKPLAPGEALMMNVGTATTVGASTGGSGKGLYGFNLKLAVCARNGQRVTLARRYGTRWRLIGYGIVK